MPAPNRREPAVKVGRPSLLTPETLEQILQNVRLGMFLDGAAARAGVCKDTALRWQWLGRKAIREGKADDLEAKPYVEFFNSVEKAMADADAGDLAVIQRAALQGDWKAAAWRLNARGRYQQPSAKVTVEQTTADGAEGQETTTTTVTVGSGALTDDEYATAAEAVLRQRRAKKPKPLDKSPAE